MVNELAKLMEELLKRVLIQERFLWIYGGFRFEFYINYLSKRQTMNVIVYCSQIEREF